MLHCTKQSYGSTSNMLTCLNAIMTCRSARVTRIMTDSFQEADRTVSSTATMDVLPHSQRSRATTTNEAEDDTPRQMEKQATVALCFSRGYDGSVMEECSGQATLSLNQ